MKIELDTDIDPRTAEAISTALAQHLGRTIELGLPSGETVSPAGEEVWEAGEDVYTDRERRLREDIEKIKEGGPPEGHAKIEEIGKLFVRERLELVFDEVEYEDGTFANWDADERLPADGLIAGVGRIHGRKVFFTAHDYTVKAGSLGEIATEKMVRISERAADARAPMLRLIDSTGARISGTWTGENTTHANRYTGGRMFYNQCIHSGQYPQIGVLYGPCIAGSAYEPIFCDFLVMVEEISGMAIASPRIIEEVIGEDIDMADLGGPEVHATKTGSTDFVVPDERAAAEKVRSLIEYLPQDYQSPLPTKDPKQPAKNPNALDQVIPEGEKAYDMHDVIDHLVDRGSFLELKPSFGRELITGFARFDGDVVGVIANQPEVNAGAIYPDSAEKAAGFIWKCDAYDIPLLYLVDTPGFMVGSRVEHDGILQKGKRFLYATSSAEVPTIAVILRKSYAAGTYAMASPAFEPDVTLALPSAMFALLGPEAATNALFADEIAEIDDPEERAAYVEEKRAEFETDIRKQASTMQVDELLPAGDLREQLVRRFETLENKRREGFDRRHGTMLF